MNPQLNKKVKKYLDSYFRDTKTNSPEHQEAVMLVMRGALTDANFHSEAKQLGKYFPKASKKYIGTPMEGVIEDKGIDIAKMAKWDGHGIIDAFAFYLSMSIGGSFGNRLMSLKESLEESLVIEGERLDEKNCPTDASKWSYYKSQAKKKFDVYPSAYANGWASKQYKAAGGGWKSCKKESVDEAMVSPKRGHNYYQLTKDTPIKYVSGHSGIGLEVPGVLLHNEYDTIKGKKGAYIIDYFGAHFYVDIKNKFASRIAHPENREQNKDLMKNVKSIDVAPDHSDWKKYVRESVNEGPIDRIIGGRPYEYIGDGRKGKAVVSGPMKDSQKVDIIKKAKKAGYTAKPNMGGGVTIFIESVNEAYVIFYAKKKGDKPSQAAYRDKDMAVKFEKDLKKDGYITMMVNKKIKGVDESVNESASRTAGEIGGLTGVNKDAIQKFVDDNKLDIEKVYQFVKKGKLADRMKLVSAIAGKPNNPVQKKMVKQFGESVNEAKSITLISFGGRKTKYNNSDIDGFIRDLDLSAEDLPGLLYKASMKNSGLIGTRNKSFKKKKEAILKLLKRIKSHNGDVIIDVDSKKSPIQHRVVFESVNETLIKEAKVRLGKDSVNFKVMGDAKGLTLMAATGNDLDGLQDAIANDVDVKEELRKTLEKQLKVPVEVDRGYDGAGFRFNIDFYSLAKKVK